MIPKMRPDVGVGELTAALAARSSVADFEAAFAEIAGQKHALAFSYGRTGLMILLEALGLSGREVICPAYTCVVVAHAIVRSGNKPVFVDSEAHGFNMELERAEAAITGNTGALIATSIHGYPVDLDKLAKIQQRHPDLVIIQDCAHSFFAQWNGRPVQRAGKAAIYGLNISKIMTSIFGGMITTDDTQLYEALVKLRSDKLTSVSGIKDLAQAVYLGAASAALTPQFFTVVKAIERMGMIDRFVKYYDPDVIDMPDDYLVAMGARAASVGYAQCGKYNKITNRRRELVETYGRGLRGLDGIAVAPEVEGATYSHYVARVEDADAVVTCAAGFGVELGRVIDYCVPDMPAYRPYVSNTEAFGVTRRLNREVINLPLGVSDRHAQRVLEVVSQCVKR